MKISKIVPQKKHKDRCSLFIDGDFTCGLSFDIVTKYHLHEGDTITREEIDTILLQEEKMKIRNCAYKLLGYRDRSTKELQQRLIEKGFDACFVREVIDEFKENQTLDDQRYTHAFVHDYTYVTPKGNIFIKNELRKRGIPACMIDAELKSRDERKLITDYIERKLMDFDTNDIKQRQKLINRLLRKGFSPSLVYEIARERQQKHEKH